MQLFRSFAAAWILIRAAYSVAAAGTSSQLRGKPLSDATSTFDAANAGQQRQLPDPAVVVAPVPGQQRHMREGALVCRITIESTRMEDGTDVDVTLCIPIKDGRESDRSLPIELPAAIKFKNEMLILEGRLVLQITNARTSDMGVELSDASEYTKLSSDDAAVHYDNQNEHRRVLGDRRLATTGTQTISIVRISAINGTNPSTKDQLMKAFFGPTGSVKTQTGNCSFGALNWTPGPFFNLKLKTNIKNFATKDAMQTAIEAKLKAIVKTDLRLVADKVIFCYPQNSPGSWIASASFNWWKATFNAGWCLSLSADMHELGHTIGLLHSSKDGDTYGDTSGYLGYSDGPGPAPIKCFNAHKNWQLGWYQGRRQSINGTALVRLATFVDYDKTAANEPVVLEINSKFYLQYNRIKSFNTQSDLFLNQVTVVGVLDGGNSVALGGLSAGQSYTDGVTTIRACSSLTGSSGQDIMMVAINRNCPA